MMRRVMVLMATALAGVMLVGCGSEPAADTTSQEAIEDLEARVQEAERKAADATEQARQAADEAAAEASSAADVAAEEEAELAADEAAEDTSSSGGTGCKKLPNVVGKDHQLAQDTMQAAGFYLLMEEDASGQGRMLVLDRNWTTVRQRPRAGKCVSEDAEITLYAVKDSER